MKIKEILKIEKEEDRVKALYNTFNEDLRLSSNASRVEFLTTIRQINKYLKKGMKILDLGAGTGAYSLYLAEKGYDVTAVELVKSHVDLIKSKKLDNMNLKIYEGNALDLSKFNDEEFDLVLCFGPLYHLEKLEDKLKCISGIKRICSKDSFMFFSFINNDMVIATETLRYGSEFKETFYDHDTFKVVDFPFVFSTIDNARELFKNSKINIIKEIASDGYSELLADKINSLDDENYLLFLNYHFYTSEKPEFLGASNHLLFICQSFN